MEDFYYCDLIPVPLCLALFGCQCYSIQCYSIQCYLMNEIMSTGSKLTTNILDI